MVSTHPTHGEGISQYVGFLLDELRGQGFSVSTTRMYFLKDKISSLKWLSLLFCPESVVHVHYTPTGSGPLILLYGLLRNRKKRFIITSHEFPSTYGKHLPRIARALYYTFEKMTHNFADRVVVHTVMQRLELSSIGVAAEKIRVLSFPVYPVFEKRNGEAPDLDHGLFFGRITPKKGIEVLLAAMEKLPEAMHCSIVGAPAVGCESYTENLRDEVRKRGLENRVSFLGFLDDTAVSRLMYRVGFTVLPYLYLTHSAALMTTIGHGVPYIASDLPAFREIVDHYRGGILFKTGDSRDLAEKIVECTSAERWHTLVAETREAREKNSWKSFSELVAQQYV